MVHFVGAGPGAPDLITRRGAALLQTADCIIYAGSLVNPALLGLAGPDCAIYNSAEMTLEQVLAVMKENEAAVQSFRRTPSAPPRATLPGQAAASCCASASPRAVNAMYAQVIGPSPFGTPS